MVGPISRRQQFPGREMYAIQLQISGVDVDVDVDIVASRLRRMVRRYYLLGRLMMVRGTVQDSKRRKRRIWEVHSRYMSDACPCGRVHAVTEMEYLTP